MTENKELKLLNALRAVSARLIQTAGYESTVLFTIREICKDPFILKCLEAKDENGLNVFQKQIPFS